MKRLDEQTLIEHVRFLQRLAHSLLRDAARADDVVQEAWLAAVRTGPRDAAALRPWLVGTVRNLVRRTRREEGRRARRETRAARPDRVRPTADVVAHESTRRELLDAVLGLEEPYRTVVLLRFYDDLAPREIARRLGVAGSTVRTRLQRGLDMLRNRLDAGRGGNRRAWCLALVPVAAQPARAATVAGVSSSLGKGMLAMKPKIVAIAIPLCVLAVLLLWRLGDGAETRRAPDDARPATPVAKNEAASARPTAEPEAEPTPPVAPPRLRGLVRVPDGLTGESVELIIAAGRRSLPANVTAGRPFETDVALLFRDAVPPELVVRARHRDTLPARVEITVWVDPDTGRPVLPSVEIDLRAAAVVTGSVVTGAREGLAATIAAFPVEGGTPRERAVAHVTCDADGAYRLPLAEGGRYLVVAVAAGLRPAAQLVDARSGATTDTPALRLEPGVTITGQVRLNGTPAEGATATATLVEPGLTLKIPRLPWQLRYAGTVEHRVASATADAEGRYVIGGLAPAAFRVYCSSIVDGHYALTALPLAQELERSVTAPAERVDFDVAAAGLDVTIAPATTASLEVTEAGENYTYTGYVQTDDDGTKRFWVRPGARYKLLARHKGQPPQEAAVTAPKAGERTEVTLEFAAQTAMCTLEVTVRPRSGTKPPLPAGLWLTLERGKERPFVERGVFAEGRYVLRGLAPGEYRVVAMLAGLTACDGGYYRAEPQKVVLAPGATARLTFDAYAGGRLEVLVRAPDGRTDLETVAKLTRADTGKEVVVSYAKYEGSRSMSAQHVIPDLSGPAWVAEVLEPGRYRLAVEADGYAPRAVEFDVEAGRTAEVTIDLGQ